jgi:hypothetical protein
MSKWAEVVDGVVRNIVVADSAWVNGQSNPEQWIEYFDTNPAKINGDYINGVFHAPQPYPSWTRDEDGDWMPPTPYPTDIYHDWQWNESEMKWTAVQRQD